MAEKNEREIGEVGEVRDLVPSRLQDAAIVPIMSAGELEAQWNQYRDMENRILQEDDYIYWVEYKSGGKVRSVVCMHKQDAEKTKARLKLQNTPSTITRRKKKSAYRKMARFFGLFVPDQAVADVEIAPLGDSHFVQIERGNGITLITYMDENLNAIKAEVTVTTVSPSGKASVGVGVCSAEERMFAHPDHDIKATAFTRALNRSISDLVGWGEVSAEEVLSGGEIKESRVEKEVEGEAKVVSEGEDEKKEKDVTLSAFLAEAFKLGWTMDRIVERFGALEEIPNRSSILEMIKKEEENE